MLWFFRPLQIVPLVTAASSKVDVVAALRSADAKQVTAAAKIMGDHCDKGGEAEQKAYAEAGAIPILVAAMATHKADPGTQEQLCWAVRILARLDSNKVCILHITSIALIFICFIVFYFRYFLQFSLLIISRHVYFSHHSPC